MSGIRDYHGEQFEEWRAEGDDPEAFVRGGGAGGSPERRRSRSGGEPPAPPATPHHASPQRPAVVGEGDDYQPDDLQDETRARLAEPLPGFRGRRGQRNSLTAPEPARASLSAEQRLLLLDTWLRSGLPAGDFAALVGISKHTLYAWKKRFEQEGPAGLMDQPRGAPRGSRLPELTKRTILMLKTANPEWGCERISAMLLRGPALPASPNAVAKVLHEAGYALEDVPTRPHPDHVRSFERATPNQLWQTDLFTFVLKRQNRRVYLVAFLDDHSRFIVGYGLHASQSSALVIEVLRASLGAYGTPEEVLTDNGSQYVTWRGKSAFTKELEKHGVKQIVATPRRPQTLGKIERFWGTLWRECVEAAVFVDLGDARQRIGHFIDHYNFQRVHSGIAGMVPADRFFGAATEVKHTLSARVQANALELARQGLPKSQFYLTGQSGGRPFSVHSEGERMILTHGQQRREIDLLPPTPADAAPAIELPQPVCPQGNTPTEEPDDDEPFGGAACKTPSPAPRDGSSSSMPEPVCPQGVANTLPEVGFEEPPTPGASPLDADLERVRAALGSAPGGDQ